MNSRFRPLKRVDGSMQQKHNRCVGLWIINCNNSISSCELSPLMHVIKVNEQCPFYFSLASIYLFLVKQPENCHFMIEPG